MIKRIVGTRRNSGFAVMAMDYSKLTDDELFEALEAAILKTHHASQPGVPVSRQHKENSVWYAIGNEVDARGESVSRPRYLIMLKAEHPAFYVTPPLLH